MNSKCQLLWFNEEKHLIKNKTILEWKTVLCSLAKYCIIISYGEIIFNKTTY